MVTAKPKPPLAVHHKKNEVTPSGLSWRRCYIGSLQAPLRSKVSGQLVRSIGLGSRHQTKPIREEGREEGVRPMPTPRPPPLQLTDPKIFRGPRRFVIQAGHLPLKSTSLIRLTQAAAADFDGLQRSHLHFLRGLAWGWEKPEEAGPLLDCSQTGSRG